MTLAEKDIFAASMIGLWLDEAVFICEANQIPYRLVAYYGQTFFNKNRSDYDPICDRNRISFSVKRGRISSANFNG